MVYGEDKQKDSLVHTYIHTEGERGGQTNKEENNLQTSYSILCNLYIPTNRETDRQHALADSVYNNSVTGIVLCIPQQTKVSTHQRK